VTVGAIVNPNGTPQFASQGVTVARTGIGTYTINIAPGIFTSVAIPMFLPLSGIAAATSTNGFTVVNVTLFHTAGIPADLFFHFTMTQVRPYLLGDPRASQARGSSSPP
jgi:hypothetical protein